MLACFGTIDCRAKAECDECPYCNSCVAIRVFDDEAKNSDRRYFRALNFIGRMNERLNK